MSPQDVENHTATVAGMFSRIAPGYDRANRLLSGGVDILWRRQLVRQVEKRLAPRSRRRVLDLAAGTLDVSLALARRIPGLSVTALDVCFAMLAAGKGKLARAGAYERGRIARLAGDALALPLRDNCVDAVTVAFGLRNMRPRLTALREAHRVLGPGGCLHILEFGSAKARIWGGVYNWYLRSVLPFFGGLVAGDREAYHYLARTVTDFPAADVLGGELEEAGFTNVEWRSLWGGIVYLHTGQKPLMDAASIPSCGRADV